jgi:hypothetical protein
MKPIDQSPHICSLDPVTLGGLAIGALAGGGTALAANALGGGAGAAPTPAPQQATPPPQQQPTGAKPTPQSQASTFLGAAATPQPVQSGQKTLLGQ